MRSAYKSAYCFHHKFIQPLPIVLENHQSYQLFCKVKNPIVFLKEGPCAKKKSQKKLLVQMCCLSDLIQLFFAPPSQKFHLRKPLATMVSSQKPFHRPKKTPSLWSSKDTVITEQEKERSVRECNGHSAFWRRIVGHPATDALVDRITSALTKDQFLLPPPMVGNSTDHKAGNNLPLRVICQAKSAPNNRLSWILAKVVGKVGEEAPESKAMYATEEMQDMMMKVNSKLAEHRTTKEVGIGSMAVVGLYPALEKEKVKTILEKMLLRTEVKVAQVKWKEVGV